jgi:hypothetical protein
VNGKSLDIRQSNTAILRKLFPHVFSEGRIDLEKIKAMFGEEPYFQNEHYTLNWVGKAENRGDFYYINNELAIALTKMDLEVAAKIIELQPQKAITLDRLFAGNDELKTNTALQMMDAGVEFREV